MKVELIGTGCIGTKQNSASSIVNKKILIDAPNGICKTLRNLDKPLEYIQTVIITHFHADHIFDLPFLILEKAIDQGETQIPFNIVGPKGIKERTKTLYELAFTASWEKVNKMLNINYIEILPGETKYIDDLTLEAVKVEHDAPEAQGYILTIDNQRCAFTGDTKKCEGVDYLLSKSKIVITDCAKTKGIETHMGIDNIQEYSEKYHDNIIITTHMREDTRKELEKLEIENLIVPQDGYNLDF